MSFFCFLFYFYFYFFGKVWFQNRRAKWKKKRKGPGEGGFMDEDDEEDRDDSGGDPRSPGGQGVTSDPGYSQHEMAGGQGYTYEVTESHPDPWVSQGVSHPGPPVTPPNVTSPPEVVTPPNVTRCHDTGHDNVSPHNASSGYGSDVSGSSPDMVTNHHQQQLRDLMAGWGGYNVFSHAYPGHAHWPGAWGGLTQAFPPHYPGQGNNPAQEEGT